jgi:hypothetical protein
MDARPPLPPVPPWRPPPTDPAPRRVRRLTRSVRGAAGLGILAAALLLWPFAGFTWIPWAAGLIVLALLAVLRLDRFLRGWAGHVAGAVAVGGLMLSTGPWDWALAASIGVLLAGLARLPAWRLAAVGAVLCVLAGVGWGVDRYRDAQAQEALARQHSAESFSLMGEAKPERVLPALLEGIGQDDVTGVCGLLAEPARATFVQAAGAADCPAAVARFHTALPTVPPLRNLDAPVAGAVVDGCRTPWARPGLGGPALGVVEISQAAPPGRTWFVSGFRPCP